MDPWWPLLKAGEVLHVGKGTAFGLGRYRIERP
jgi:CRISPR/Cas system endoribonuclease Cas6 (RAMP superfamily)